MLQGRRRLRPGPCVTRRGLGRIAPDASDRPPTLSLATCVLLFALNAHAAATLADTEQADAATQILQEVVALRFTEQAEVQALLARLRRGSRQ